MIQSMTGYGSAQDTAEGTSLVVEVRSVNNRYLKLSIKLPEHLQFAENAVDRLIRSRISRGAIDFALRVRTEGVDLAGRINGELLQRYVDLLTRVRVPPGVQTTIDLATVAELPGVCETPSLDDDSRDKLVQAIARLTEKALDALTEMRRDEGTALRADLLAACEQIEQRLAHIQERAPLVVEEYHARLKTRVEMLVKAGGYDLPEDGLLREVAIFAERCDVMEELTRLSSHLKQFRDLCDRGEQVGRTLDFLTQELLREANTIASKSNDTRISRSIVEIKGLIDRLREQVQNAE